MSGVVLELACLAVCTAACGMVLLLTALCCCLFACFGDRSLLYTGCLPNLLKLLGEVLVTVRCCSSRCKGGSIPTLHQKKASFMWVLVKLRQRPACRLPSCAAERPPSLEPLNGILACISNFNLKHLDTVCCEVNRPCCLYASSLLCSFAFMLRVTIRCVVSVRQWSWRKSDSAM